MYLNPGFYKIRYIETDIRLLKFDIKFITLCNHKQAYI